MEIVIIFILLALVIVMNVMGANMMKKAALLKGYGDDYHVWELCFWLGIFGYLYVIALPDLITQSQNHQIIELMQKGE